MLFICERNRCEIYKSPKEPRVPRFAPVAQPLFVDDQGRIIRFMLKAGQSILEHNVPHSPFYVIILEGNGIFKGADEQGFPVEPNMLLVFDPAENYSVFATDGDLVFIGILHGVPSAHPEKSEAKWDVNS